MMSVDIRRWIEQLTEMRTALESAERGCLLVVVTTDGSLEQDLAEVLAEAVDGQGARYTFDPIYPSLAAHLETLSPSPPRLVLALGLDDLPPEPRQRALEYLNQERESIRRTGHSVVLFVRPGTVQHLTFQAGDFWAWRSGLYEFLAPPDEVARQEALAALRFSLPATLEALRRRYLDYVVATYRWLDFRGLMQVRNLVRLPLTDVYVPLSATVEERRLEAPEALIERRKQAAGPEKRREPERFRAVRAETVTRRVELSQALRESRRLVVLGDPGSGKSTLLKYLALTFAQGEGGGESPLPILVPIAAYALALRDGPDMRLADFLPRHFRRLGLPDLGALFIHTMERGQAALLLDGLDEVVSAEERRAIVGVVKRLVTDYPQNCFVVTSRIAGYAAGPLGGDFTSLTVAPFDSEDIGRFAHQWSRAYETVGMERTEMLPPEIARRAEARADNLVAAVTSRPAIERLATNPLLLTILALIHYQGARLPNRRVELYRLCVEALAETWNLARSLSGRPVDLWLGERRLDEREVVKVLAPIAYWMQEEKPGGLVEREELERRIASELEREGRRADETQALAHDFVKLMREQVGLLVERGLEQFGFVHLTFQEYLAVRHIAAQEQPFALLKPHLHDPRWREVILLTAGYLGDFSSAHATRFVQAIREAKSSYESLLHRDLLLTLRVLADDVPVTPDLSRQLLDEAFHLLGTARYWNWKLHEEVTSRLGALGRGRYKAEVVSGLLAALRDEEWWVRQAAAEALEKLGRASEEVIGTLLVAMRDDDERIRQAAVEVLGKLGRASEEVVGALLAALRDEDEVVQWAAVEAFGDLGQASEEVVGALLALLQDEDAEMRRAAADALGKLGQASEEVVGMLLVALGDDDEGVRRVAAEALGKSGQASKEVVEALLAALGDDDEGVRRVAAEALGKLGQTSEEVVGALLVAMRDKRIWMRETTAVVLGELGCASEEVILSLNRMLRSWNGSDVTAAATALADIGQPTGPLARRLALLLGYQWWLPWHLPWLPRCLWARWTTDTSALFEALWTVVDRGPVSVA